MVVSGPGLGPQTKFHQRREAWVQGPLPDVSSHRSLQTRWGGRGCPASCFLPLGCPVGTSPLPSALTLGPSADPLKGGLLLHQQKPSSYGPALCLAALGRPGEESSPRLVSWAEGWPMGLVWAPMGGDGVQSFQRCPDVPAPCVPAVAANTAPIFESNMSAVSLPEDLPVGEYLCPDRTKPSPQRGPGGPPWACSPSLQLHITSMGKDGPKGVCTRSFFFSAF